MVVLKSTCFFKKPIFIYFVRWVLYLDLYLCILKIKISEKLKHINLAINYLKFVIPAKAGHVCSFSSRTAQA
jgi:hypothetical protein